MKFKNNVYGFISFKHIILLLLFGYIIWLVNVFYHTAVEIDKMYIDSYTKQLDEKKKIEELIKIKTNEKQLFEEQEELRHLKEKEAKEKAKKQKEGILLKNIDSNSSIENTYLDPINDDSIKKFVTSNKSFNNKKYVPSGLAKISSDYISDLKGGSQVLRSVANDSLQSMAEQFFKDTLEKIVIVSAYRSYEYQKGIKDRGCPDNLCAKAGYSEHQSGLAVDLWEASTNYEWKNSTKLQKYYKWLDENAYKYGFHNTYQKGLKVDGYEIEPWHWRYVGVDLATYLWNNNLTLAEYYK